MQKFLKALKAKARRPPKRTYILLLATMTIIVGAGGLFYSHSELKERSQKGVLAEDQQFPTTPEVAYKNLDLKIAAKAHFEGNPVKKIEGLEVSNNISVSVISFRVPADNLTEYALM